MAARQVVVALLVSVTVSMAGFSAQADEQPVEDPTAKIPRGVIEQELLPVAYAGTEYFRFDVSYTGGLKLGELHMTLSGLTERPDTYQIDALVTTENGMFSAIYPIKDRHVTKVHGEKRLPYHYEVWQKEGYSYEAHRVTTYDQRNGRIAYRHNDKLPEIYDVGGDIHNEFSSFFASRIMPLVPNHPFLVSTFADHQRNEVVVMVRGKEKLEETLLGTVDTVVVEPIMKFSGLYDKRGDTVIWYTDDRCRVPVTVNSKLLIGSLTATLVEYRNPQCPEFDGAMLEKYRKEKKKAKKS